MNNPPQNQWAIVLHVKPYTDNADLVQLLSKENGKFTCIRYKTSAQSKKRTAYLPPLCIIARNPTPTKQKGLPKLGEFTTLYPQETFFFNPIKASIAFFFAEILTLISIEHQPDPELFNLACHYHNLLYHEPEELTNLPLSFLCSTTETMGIRPLTSTYNEKNTWFSIPDGAFTPEPKIKSNPLTLNAHTANSLFLAFELNTIPQGKIKRKELLKSLLQYMAYHIPALNSIKSLHVLEEIWNS
jgi:recombinational DNA repair protein (RecF pathway)